GNYFFLEPGLLIDLYLVSNSLFYIFVGDLAREFGNDYPVVGIPLANNLPFGYLFPVLHEQLGTIRNVIGTQGNSGLAVRNLDFRCSGNNDFGIPSFIIVPLNGP